MHGLSHEDLMFTLSKTIFAWFLGFVAVSQAKVFLPSCRLGLFNYMQIFQDKETRPLAACVISCPLMWNSVGFHMALRVNSGGRPIFIQCWYWEEFLSLYEGAEPQPSTG